MLGLDCMAWGASAAVLRQICEHLRRSDDRQARYAGACAGRPARRAWSWWRTSRRACMPSSSPGVRPITRWPGTEPCRAWSWVRCPHDSRAAGGCKVRSSPAPARARYLGARRRRAAPRERNGWALRGRLQHAADRRDHQQLHPLRHKQAVRGPLARPLVCNRAWYAVGCEPACAAGEQTWRPRSACSPRLLQELCHRPSSSAWRPLHKRSVSPRTAGELRALTLP